MPSSYALCDVDDVRGFLQKQTADTNQDAVVEAFIDAASKAIQNRFGKFAPPEASVAKSFVYAGAHRLDLFPYFARTVTAVSFDTQTSSPDALDSAVFDWQLRPVSPMDGAYRWIRLPNHTYSSSLNEATVSVTGTWGFEEIPPDVKQAAVITVVEWIRKDVAAFSTTYSIDSDRLDVPAAIPRAALALLETYSRNGQG